MNPPSSPPSQRSDEAPPPAVSVVVATRNRPLVWVERVLNSIRSQDLADFEAILVDDGSSAEVLAEQAALRSGLDPRFIVDGPAYPGARGTGPSGRNRGIRRSHGEFVAFCDDDDRWIINNHLSVGVEMLRRHNADLFIGNMRGESGETITRADWFPNAPQLTAGRRLSEKPAVYEVSLPAIARTARHSNIHPNSCIVRRSLIDRVGLFWERIDYGEDIEWVMRLADGAGKILYRADCVAAYTHTPRVSMSTQNTKIEQLLEAIVGAQRLSVVSSHREVRRYAHSIEAWELRKLAKIVRDTGRPAAAAALAWRALCICPTAGAAIDWLKSIPPVLSHRKP